jgi:hypothetical protein
MANPQQKKLTVQELLALRATLQAQIDDASKGIAEQEEQEKKRISDLIDGLVKHFGFVVDPKADVAKQNADYLAQIARWIKQRLGGKIGSLVDTTTRTYTKVSDADEQTMKKMFSEGKQVSEVYKHFAGVYSNPTLYGRKKKYAPADKKETAKSGDKK